MNSIRLLFLAASLAFAATIAGGCRSGCETYESNMANPAVAVDFDGFLFHDRRVEPQEVPLALKRAGVSTDQVIYIRVHITANATAAQSHQIMQHGRTMMGVLAACGYKSSVLVTPRRAEAVSTDRSRSR